MTIAAPVQFEAKIAMRIFVLCTGRCGSTTLAKACKHMTNYTAGHESAMMRDNLNFPDNHIEVNLSLVWYAGLLRQRFPNARYVHLTHDPEETALSTAGRGDSCHTQILHAWRYAVRQGWQGEPRDLLVDAREYVNATTALIELLLRGVSYVDVRCGDVQSFVDFWHWVGATGDLDAAIREFNLIHNWNPNRHLDWKTKDRS